MSNAVSKYLRDRAEINPENLPEPNPALCMVVVIPAYREPDLNRTLKSLLNCTVPLAEKLEVIVVLNRPADDIMEEENMKVNQRLIQQLNRESSFPIHGISRIFYDEKKAGVGLARKVGMDMALKRLVKVNGLSGWIVCLDADCTVSSNYLSELLMLQENDMQAVAGTIRFEHQIPEEGAESAIYQYELHLRYYVEMQRRLALPYAVHTVGSAMFVRALDYAQKGGMNTRKAGEDFYFLHKFTLDKGFRDFSEPVVYPSARASKRVPFGTGRAIVEFDKEYLSYHPNSFADLSVFLNWVRKMATHSNLNTVHFDNQDIPESIRSFLQEQDFFLKLEEFNKHTASPSSFLKRFYQWFNAFRLMKCLHYLRDHFYPSVPILELAFRELPEKLQNEGEDLLALYRDKNNFDQWRAG